MWTKIEEGYPEDKQRILFTVEDMTNHKRFVVLGVYTKIVDKETGEITNKFHMKNAQKDYNDGKAYRTVAWMPAPEPCGGAEFKVIVAGSRSFDNFALMCSRLDEIFKNRMPSAIVCGEAKGADTLGKKYAEKRGIPVECYPADWEHQGKQAGYIRNEVMAEVADACVVFWDGKSSGTNHMIETAKKRKLQLRVIKFEV